MRVTIQQSDGEGVNMKIEGKIAGPKASALNEAWQDMARLLGQRKLLVDLRGLTHIDGIGRNLLADMHANTGAAFLADTPLTKYFAEEAQQGVRTRCQ